jgi:uncharacterized membrane protein (DUF485 family)
MTSEAHIFAIAHVIQLAVAPVFLLSGVGMVLTVLLSRLNRIVDRARTVEGYLPSATEHVKAAYHKELHTLSRRARLAHWAITLTTICGLLVCLVIAALFAGHFLRVDLSPTIVGFFIVAMLAIVLAFILFLREIYLGTAGLRFGPY